MNDDGNFLIPSSKVPDSTFKSNTISQSLVDLFNNSRKTYPLVLTGQWKIIHSDIFRCVDDLYSPIKNSDMAVCQHLVPLVNIKIAGKWMFIPLKMVLLIGIDPYPYPFTSYFDVHQGYKVLTHCHIATSNDQITTDTPYAALRWMALRGSLLGFDTTRMLRITGAPWAVTMAHWGLVVYHIKLYGKYKMKIFWRFFDAFLMLPSGELT